MKNNVLNILMLTLICGILSGCDKEDLDNKDIKDIIDLYITASVEDVPNSRLALEEHITDQTIKVTWKTSEEEISIIADGTNCLSYPVVLRQVGNNSSDNKTAYFTGNIEESPKYSAFYPPIKYKVTEGWYISKEVHGDAKYHLHAKFDLSEQSGFLDQNKTYMFALIDKPTSKTNFHVNFEHKTALLKITPQFKDITNAILSEVSINAYSVAPINGEGQEGLDIKGDYWGNVICDVSKGPIKFIGTFNQDSPIYCYIWTMIYSDMEIYATVNNKRYCGIIEAESKYYEKGLYTKEVEMIEIP